MKLAWLWPLATAALYFANKALYRRYPRFWLSPIIVTPLLLVCCILWSGVAYPVYAHSTGWLLWLLGPATIAFAVPVYEHRALVRRHWLTLTAGTLTGVIVSLLTSWFLARFLGLPPEVGHSLLVHSISTPFAIVVSPQLGGSGDLAAFLVILTGVFGMLVGEALLALLPLRSRLAIGMPMGAAAHAVGTIKAREISAEQGAMASLTMVFSGVVTVLAASALVRLLR
jgi:putative effector of murein hydrolase